jgi:branched-chain amino acid transport system substrate-binding protein
MSRKPLTRAAALAICVSAALLAAGCGKPGDAEPAASGPIKIAIIDPQSGQMSSLGQWEHKGIKLAIDEANAAGGINGRAIELTILDDQGDPTASANHARKVASQGYVAVLGSSVSGATLAMAPVLAQAQIPVITSGQSPKLAELNNPYLFLNSPTSVTFGQTLAKHAVTEAGIKSIAMITNNGAYGKGEHDAFRAALAELGVTPVDDQIVTPDQKDFSAALTAIRKKSPAALFVGAEEVQSGLIVKQARALGIAATAMGGAPMGTDVFLETAGAEAVEGAIVSTPYPSNDANDASRKFAAAYQAAFNEQAEFHGAKAYDGAKILIAALQASNVATGKELADAIRSTNYSGLVGTFTFDENGVGVHEAQIGVAKDGKIVKQT